MIIEGSFIENINNKKEILIVDNKSDKNILFIGSCRTQAFLNYFYNDPFFSRKYNFLCIMVNTEGAVELSKTANTNTYLKSLISKSSILVAEYLINYNSVFLNLF